MQSARAIGSTRTTRSRRWRLLIPGMLAVVGLVVGVGVAAGAIPGSDGVVHGCYNTGSNPSGQLRVIDPAAGAKCSKNEKPLDFNQEGPKGDQGIQGVPGASGTSTVYTASGGTDVHPISVSVPAGSYLVVGSAVIFNEDASNPQTAACILQEDTIVANVTLASFSFATVPIMGTVVLASAGTISIDCSGVIGTANMFLSATKVTSIVAQ